MQGPGRPATCQGGQVDVCRTCTSGPCRLLRQAGMKPGCWEHLTEAGEGGGAGRVIKRGIITVHVRLPRPRPLTSTAPLQTPVIHASLSPRISVPTPAQRRANVYGADPRHWGKQLHVHLHFFCIFVSQCFVSLCSQCTTPFINIIVSSDEQPHHFVCASSRSYNSLFSTVCFYLKYDIKYTILPLTDIDRGTWRYQLISARHIFVI